VQLLPTLRARIGADVTVAVAAVTWSGGAALLAVTRSVPVACGAMAVAGAATMGVMTTTMSAYQSILPAWVRGRAISVAMLVIWFGASIGSIGWGALGSSIGLDRALLVAAAANLVVAVVAGATLRIGDAGDIDITPVHWPIPVVQHQPAPADGPVLITIEWWIDPSRVEEFAVAMVPIARHRRRDGAVQWGLYRDVAEPGRMTESFMVASWAEHERQHHRTIAADAAEEAEARAFLVGNDPTVTHFVAQRS
jgi:Transmembrane secretion effector